MRNGILTLFAGILCVACTGTPDISITARGELEERISRNFDMMETPRYQPENVFKSALEDWPGDIQGRTILALVRDAQSSGRQPLYLDRMIETLPDRMNGLGYFGPIYEGSTLEFKDNGTLEQDSEYPFGERISFDVNTDKVKRIALRAPSWMLDPKVMINGKETGYRSDGGFIFPEKSLKKGDRLEMDFHMEQRVEKPVNRYNTEEGQFRICLGPLVLGSDTGDRTGLKPIYHLMDPEVKVGPDYHKQILFQND